MTDVSVPGELTILVIGQTPVQPPLGAQGGGSESMPGNTGATGEDGSVQQEMDTIFDLGLMPLIIIFFLLFSSSLLLFFY